MNSNFTTLSSFNINNKRGIIPSHSYWMVKCDEAKLLSIKEVSILHGKGNGILRKLIREKLSHMHEVERFCDASLETGGTGITRVYFR